MEILPADRWCEDSLSEYDVLLKEFEELRDTPKSTEESALLRSARETRAKTKLATATIKADIASLVMQLIHDASRGTITIDVPEAQLDIKLEWK